MIYAASVALAGGLSTTAAIPVMYGTLVFMAVGVTGGTALLYGHMGALAGHPVAGYVEGEPELFMAGFSFAFAVIAAMVAVGAVLTVVPTLLKCRRGGSARISILFRAAGHTPPLCYR